MCDTTDCVAGSRLYIQSAVYDAFITELVESAKEWTAGYGDPFKDDALGGPLVSKVQRDKVAGYVDSAREEGAKVIYGGDKWPGKGWYYLPTSRYLNFSRIVIRLGTPAGGAGGTPTRCGLGDLSCHEERSQKGELTNFRSFLWSLQYSYR